MVLDENPERLLPLIEILLRVLVEDSGAKEVIVKDEGLPGN